jgi:3-methyl-2-oxobutanoate hydroxymethyltransferase
MVPSSQRGCSRPWSLVEVLRSYKRDVETRTYPGPEHTVFMKPEELAKFRQMVNWEPRR